MNLIWLHVKSFTQSNWILLSMVTIVSILIVGVYSLGNLTYVSLMIPFFIYYTQAQVLQKQQSIKYKLSLPEERSRVLALISIEFLILSLPQILTLQIFYYTVPLHPLLNPDRLFFLFYSLGGFWIYSLYLTGQWINQSRREIIINKWEAFISNLYTLISSVFKISLVILYFRVLHNFLLTYDVVNSLGRPLMILSFILISLFLHRENIKLSLKEELSVFYWKKQGIILGLIFFLILGSVFTYYQMTEKKILFSNKLFNLIQEKNWEDSQNYIIKYNRINEIKEKGWNLQSVLILYGNSELLKFALNNGLKFEKDYIIDYPKDMYFHQMNPFLLAVESESIGMIDFVYSLIKDVNSTHIEDKYNGLHLAAYKCNLKLIDHLLKIGTNPNHQDRFGKTPPMVAMERHCPIGAAYFMEHSVDLSLKDDKGLNLADYVKTDKNLKYLIEKRKAK